MVHVMPIHNDEFDYNPPKGSPAPMPTEQEAEELLKLIESPLRREVRAMEVPSLTREFEGRAVIFIDPRGFERAAVITRVWGPQCINVAFVDMGDGQEDTYGRKIARATSVMHQSIQQAHGNSWRLP